MFCHAYFDSLLKHSYELKDSLETIYDTAAQYNHPPRYPVTVVCDAIDKGPFGEDTLSRIYAAMVAYKGNRSCYINGLTNVSETSIGWRWQVTTVLISSLRVYICMAVTSTLIKHMMSADKLMCA